MADLAGIKSDRARLASELTAAGAEIRGDTFKCPFHDDQHASGSIYGGDGEPWRAKCHGGKCGFDGTVVDVVMKSTGCDFKEALAKLRVNGSANDNGDAKPPQNPRQPRGGEKPVPTVQEVQVEADAAHGRLMADPAALDHLWRTRAIDTETVKLFKVGITGKPGGRFWTFPITTAGRLVGIKAHRADGQSAKSWWKPEGIGRDHLFPVHLQPDGPVWLCPGELKALAVIASGRAALGITSGEGTETKPADLPTGAFELLRGRSVAIVADVDSTGRAWGLHVQEQLRDAGIDARIVDVGLSKAAGLKDLGDFIVQRAVDDAMELPAIGATLDDAFRRSDPWFGVRLAELWESGTVWRPVTFVSTGLTDLDRALGGGLRTRGAHLIVGKPGHAKSQLGVTLAVNAARRGVPAAVLSLELEADEVAQLVIAQLADIPRSTLARGSVGGEFLDRLNAARREWSGIPLDVLDDQRWPEGLTRDALAELVAEGVARFGWRLVVLDYLGLMRSPEADQFQADLLNSAVLRKVARKAGIALVVIAALRKSANYRKSPGDEEKGISLDDVAGAARLAYDAQSVWFVRRHQGSDGTGLVKLFPLKLRFAPMVEGAEVALRWRPATGRIEDLNNDSGVEAVGSPQ